MRCSRTGKHRYGTPQEAFAGLRSMRDQTVQRGRRVVKRYEETERLRHYHCDACGGWHVGRAFGHEQANA